MRVLVTFEFMLQEMTRVLRHQVLAAFDSYHSPNRDAPRRIRRVFTNMRQGTPDIQYLNQDTSTHGCTDWNLRMGDPSWWQSITRVSILYDSSLSQLNQLSHLSSLSVLSLRHSWRQFWASSTKNASSRSLTLRSKLFSTYAIFGSPLLLLKDSCPILLTSLSQPNDVMIE